ncbi:hypothetical protein Taro_024214 [Colocasia esculenta]|uniref:Uncharacterized protein n=1 Tax=Colocasia esculenta TaxID=4460 RepID=A0A843VJP8_COLES|nr:hypothetical protein [Colocasia esculenta]
MIIEFDDKVDKMQVSSMNICKSRKGTEEKCYMAHGNSRGSSRSDESEGSHMSEKSRNSQESDQKKKMKKETRVYKVSTPPPAAQNVSRKSPTPHHAKRYQRVPPPSQPNGDQRYSKGSQKFQQMHSNYGKLQAGGLELIGFSSILHAKNYVESQHPAADEEGPQLPGRQLCWISGGKIDPGSASCYIMTLVHEHIPGPVDAWREFPVPRTFAFTRPKDLPRARAVWESTAQTNLRKSMWEALDKATKTTGNRDPMAWLDYGPVWLRRDYWESLCECWATGPWQERSQVVKRNRSTHPEKNHYELERAPTFRELFDRSHKRKGTDDYVSESACTIAFYFVLHETYDRTMVDRYAEGTP